MIGLSDATKDIVISVDPIALMKSKIYLPLSQIDKASHWVKHCNCDSHSPLSVAPDLIIKVLSLILHNI